MVTRTIVGLVLLAVLVVLLFVMRNLGLSMAETITILVVLATLMVILGGLGLQGAKELRSSRRGTHGRTGSAD